MVVLQEECRTQGDYVGMSHAASLFLDLDNTGEHDALSQLCQL